MKKHLRRLFEVAKTGTIKDTVFLFIGNALSAFLGFLFTIVIARQLSVGDFGIFSAANNLTMMIISLSDFGLSTGLIYYLAKNFSLGKKEEAYKYAKAVLIFRLFVFIILFLLISIFSKFVSNKLIATSDTSIAYYVAFTVLFAVSWTFVPYYLQAKKEFLKSSSMEVIIGFVKLIFPLIFLSFGILTLKTTLLSFGISLVIAGVIGFILIGLEFLKANPKKETYVELIKYSGWIGVNRIISSISGKLDIQMLATMTGAVSTGLYSIPSRLSSFIIVLASSFSSVLAPRFSSFSDKEKEKRYLIKSTSVSIIICLGIVIWIIIAKPFVQILFGEKYIESIPVFRALIGVLIPFVLTVPSTTAIIYAMKKTVYIGVFSFFQIAVTFIINWLLIPKIGFFGPVVAYGVVYSVLAIYSWIIVINYYKKND